MPLSWNEIKSRAIAFSKDWSGEASERAESQSFWNAFFHVFGIERRRVASFENRWILCVPDKGSSMGASTVSGKACC
jgi:hypothetical protein